MGDVGRGGEGVGEAVADELAGHEKGAGGDGGRVARLDLQVLGRGGVDQGPTGLGEIVMYTVGYANPDGKGAKKVAGQPGWQPDGSYLTPEGERLTDPIAKAGYLRTVQDWIISPQLRTVDGVAGVDSIGGFEKQYLVEPDPVKLSAYGVSFSELAKALEASNISVGANFLERAGEAYLVRADARIRSVNEIADAVIATRGGYGLPRYRATLDLKAFARSGKRFVGLAYQRCIVIDPCRTARKCAPHKYWVATSS